MPSRTLEHASFHFKGHDGRYVLALRGQTHDIPKGPDLERGDKFGAFTKDNTEPSAPADTFIPDILVEWSPQEFNRFVDAGTANEILEKLGEVAPEERSRVARSLIEAEEGRKEAARAPLLTALNRVAGNSDADISSGNTPEVNPESSLAEFVEKNTVETIVERAGRDPEVAHALREAEQARGDKARTSLVAALLKIEDEEG